MSGVCGCGAIFLVVDVSPVVARGKRGVEVRLFCGSTICQVFNFNHVSALAYLRSRLKGHTTCIFRLAPIPPCLWPLLSCAVTYGGTRLGHLVRIQKKEKKVITLPAAVPKSLLQLRHLLHVRLAGV